MRFALSPIFCDGMILQAEKPVRVFGRGDGTLTVRLGEQTQTVDAHGRWTVTFPPLPYDASLSLSVSDGKNETVCTDVKTGDVLLLAGQSNMEFTLGESATETPCYPADGDLRLFAASKTSPTEPNGRGWVPCTPQNGLQWTSLGYFLGNELRQMTGHPVGLVGAYQGASVIESWMPADAFVPEFHLLPAQRHTDHDFEPFFWNKDHYLWDLYSPQVVPFAYKRVIWYQGESDTTVTEALLYDKMLASMIRSWRVALMDETLPFTVVVLANFDDLRGRDGWHLLQDAQRKVPSLVENVSSVECFDICETDQIHPPTKSRLAKRILQAGI